MAGRRRGAPAVRVAVLVAVLVALSLASCRTGRPAAPAGPADPNAGAPTADHPCARGAPELERLTDTGFGDQEPPPEAMEWQFAAEDLAQELQALAGDRYAGLWLVWEPEWAVALRLTEGPEIPEVQAAADASGLVVDIAYDRAFSEAELLAASDALSSRWAGLPGVSGMSVDNLSSRLLFYVASGDDGGAATCTALAEVLADAGVPYAFEVFEGPTESTVRGPVGFAEVRLVDDRTLLMNVWSCNGEPEVTLLEQTATQVRVEVTATVAAPGWAANECLDGIEVTLDAPLGDRTLIDATTGDAVDVTRPQG